MLVSPNSSQTFASAPQRSRVESYLTRASETVTRRPNLFEDAMARSAAQRREPQTSSGFGWTNPFRNLYNYG